MRIILLRVSPKFKRENIPMKTITISLRFALVWALLGSPWYGTAQVDSEALHERFPLASHEVPEEWSVFPAKCRQSGTGLGLKLPEVQCGCLRPWPA